MWEGEHFHVPHVNPWPRPIQKPHPEIWIPGLGSSETIKKCVEKGYHYMTVFSPKWMVKQFFDAYRAYAEKIGVTVERKKLKLAVMLYVAETEAQAHREAKAHLQWIYNTGLRHPQHYHGPPGYSTKQGFASMMALRGSLPEQPKLTYEELLRDRYIIVGTPQQVGEILHKEYVEELGIGGIIGMGTWGSMPKWMAMKGLQLAAEELLPLFREKGGKPDYLKKAPLVPGSVAERAATFGKPKYPAMNKVDGLEHSVPREVAHVAEVIDPSRNGKPAAPVSV
jgi:alkanesulfonate monooxygenase SsuD/methylene tetrahydromethanopterin reductase-like flavin-dependent oxidoreductase (luciferase family)